MQFHRLLDLRMLSLRGQAMTLSRVNSKRILFLVAQVTTNYTETTVVTRLMAVPAMISSTVALVATFWPRATATTLSQAATTTRTTAAT